MHLVHFLFIPFYFFPGIVSQAQKIHIIINNITYKKSIFPSIHQSFSQRIYKEQSQKTVDRTR